MWFLWVHLFDPHDPYDPPEPFKTDHENKLYDGEVAYVDHSLGTLFEYMERGDLFRRTFVVLTGDHGESPIPEYYDLKKDYNETKNLLREIKPESYRAELKSLMEEKTPSSALKKTQPQVDGRALAKLKSLGYISGSGTSADREFGQKHDVKRLLPYHNKAVSALREFQAGHMMKAVDMLKEILTERDDIDIAYSNLASIYRDMGRLGDAIEVARLGMNNLPGSYEVFSILVNYLVAAGLNDEAIALIEGKSIHAAASDPEIWNFLGVARSRKGEFDEALKAFAKSLSLDPDYPVSYMNRGLAHIGRSKKERKNVYLELAIDDFRMAIRLNPEMSSAYNGLGIALIESGYVDEAIRSWEKALELNPQSIQTHYNLGMALLDQGKKTGAFGHLETYKEKAGPFLSPQEREKLEESIAKCRVLSKK